MHVKNTSAPKKRHQILVFPLSRNWMHEADYNDDALSVEWLGSSLMHPDSEAQ